ncbi:tetratricopeptide repeat protein [Chryseolinea lacunae]|uniref:Tetratricopeptide repeat protein n=1 Tax=Chryseolinea lacunae TaxID=2801331 RepID=A0ABS1KWN3_9BACT|nr:hypothetical protein [Chryseolinea lacunae]MBL0743876.1 hypothetical protein [Chryseolinea lacunae]
MPSLQKLFDKALATSDRGNQEEAIVLYEKILAEKEDWAIVHYNLGLIYKYQNTWDKSYYHNKRAVALESDNAGAHWNLGIAATMLKDWKLARQCWNFFGMKYELIDEDTAGNVGDSPVRIDPSNKAEVVWARRICPARAVILNIPCFAPKHRFRDMILNDGAPNGYRMSDGVKYPVFDELQHLEQSRYQTFSLKCRVLSESQYKDLEGRCKAVDIEIQNWTTTVRLLCRKCSEGTPHEKHDEDLKKDVDEFLIGIASTSEELLSRTLETWFEETGIDYYDQHSYE